MKIIHRWLPSYHILHSDGAWGTVNADGFINLNFFAEQPPVPAHFVLEVDPHTGAFTGDKSMPVEEPDYYVVHRAMQVGISIGAGAAVRLRDALNAFIEASEKQQGLKKE